MQGNFGWREKVSIIMLSFLCAQHGVSKEEPSQTGGSWEQSVGPYVQFAGAIAAATVAYSYTSSNPSRLYKFGLPAVGAVSGYFAAGALGELVTGMRAGLAFLNSDGEAGSEGSGSTTQGEGYHVSSQAGTPQMIHKRLPPTMSERIGAIDNSISQMQNDIQQNDKKAVRGIAAVAAMGNVVMPSAPGKTVVGAGMGRSDGIQALAVSISHRPEKLGNMAFQAAIGASNGGKPVARAGISYEF